MFLYKTIEMRPLNNPTRTAVWRMFNRIAGRYDLLNRLLSFGCDIYWRKKLARYIPRKTDCVILDAATGTADVLLTAITECECIKYAVGIDRAGNMLKIGREKLRKKSKSHSVLLFPADAAAIPFAAYRFDVVTIAFGIRNVENVETALREIHRVLKNGGRLLILEFSLPHNSLIKKAYLCYFRYVLPFVGRVISGDRYAYQYLNETVESFPYGEHFCLLLRNCGFSKITAFPLTFGIVTLYCADK